MRRLLVLPLIAVSAFAVRSVVADDAKTYTFPAHGTWKVGDVATRTESDHKIQKQVIKGADGTEMKNETTDELVEYRAVKKILEVDADGLETKSIVYFAKWSRKTGEVADVSLEGAHVEVSGTGAARKAKVLTTGTAVSAEATTWVEEQLGKGGAKHDESDAVMNPKKPVAVGESWSPDLAGVQKMFGDKMSFLADKSKVTLTLTGVEGDVANLKLEFALQAGPMDTPQGKLEWKDGGMLELTGTSSKPLKPEMHVEEGKMSGSFKGTILAGPGITVELDMTMENLTHVEAGGEMPEAPASK